MNLLLEIPFTFVFLENFILVQYFGINVFPSMKRSIKEVAGYGGLLTISMSVAALLTPLVELLVPSGAPKTLLALVFTSVSGVIAWIFIVLVRLLKSYRSVSLERLLTLVLCNASVWAVVLVIHEREYSFVQGLIAAFTAGLGLSFVLIVLTTIQKRLAHEAIPEYARTGLLFISAALVSLAVLPIDRIFLHDILNKFH